MTKCFEKISRKRHIDLQQVDQLDEDCIYFKSGRKEENVSTADMKILKHYLFKSDFCGKHLIKIALPVLALCVISLGYFSYTQHSKIEEQERIISRIHQRHLVDSVDFSLEKE